MKKLFYLKMNHVINFFFFYQGNKNNFHFGFTCRDSSSSENCIGYIFKCESESVANELVTGWKYIVAHNIKVINNFFNCF